MRYLKLQTFITSLLRDKSGANAVEYALIMALGGVFIISGLILMSTEMASLFNAMGQCLGDVVNCSAETFEGSCNVAHENCGVNASPRP